MKKWLTGITILFVLTIIPVSFAQTDENITVITKSDSMQEIIFDGKWTFPEEWKISAAEILKYENNEKFYLRTAHYENFIYVMINFETDIHVDKNSDKATICFDSENKKKSKPTESTYCYTVTLGQNQGSTFQGGTDLVNKGYMKQIENHDGFIAIAKPSDENDRYNKNSHATYEFRIPIDQIGRIDNYGFFVSVFEANSDKFYTWPKDLRENVLEFPSPEKWGTLVSPDKTLPEFSQITALIVGFSSIFVLIKFSNKFGLNQRMNF
ncbi:hypothetical protein SCCGRSA3_00117 [Marine Group I thaumarchaeote SCGC RSA3]|uniref:Uncharacterized protein n=3 Tax=Marine Group I TaxID=905826 RepID=A0A081RQB3_9ARCH|nr:hypothetical protein AAA799N04_00063 [Marine Group I thaumarchaeote SCGC AAA799-N04]KFM14464.1 hypothetical protein AAA799D11_01824 [Marine Group I thaumarchaeote SCGC AAA799-D11]KFM20661.1 hypothetical protein SCCGRSA3_00117 [Marine Group I thaumarchaeote SCGC RSA3]